MRKLQIGPTCGFYAISYALNLLGIRHNDHAMVAELLTGALKFGNCKVGEIFDVNLFPTFVSWTQALTGSAVTCEVVEIEKYQDIDCKYGEIIILPYVKKELPHYCVIKKITEDTVTINEGKSIFSKTLKKKELYEKHLMLPSTFNWKTYATNRKKETRFFIRKSSKTVYELEETAFRKKRSTLKGTTASTNIKMRGFMVVIGRDARFSAR